MPYRRAILVVDPLQSSSPVQPDAVGVVSRPCVSWPTTEWEHTRNETWIVWPGIQRGLESDRRTGFVGVAVGSSPTRGPYIDVTRQCTVSNPQYGYGRWMNDVRWLSNVCQATIQERL